MPRAQSPGSAYTVSSESEAESYAPSDSPPPKKRQKTGPAARRITAKSQPEGSCRGHNKNKALGHEVDIEDVADGPASTCIHRPHGISYHDTRKVQDVQEALLSWFEDVREKRGMPWRKPYDDSLTDDEKGQRAYEIWVSEIMLQQTQVATVIAYWKRWIERWPTIADLAEADVENTWRQQLMVQQVNAAWKGLGYYRRARSLLAGAKTVMGSAKYKGRLPSDPVKLEKEIDGVGRYTAGAISSMAYGVRTPIVDGNIHRLLTRLLALHGTQTSPLVIKFLWNAATELVNALPIDERDGIAGDWNQALMELGSQVCKPTTPDCAVCPFKGVCHAYAETTATPPLPSKGEETCDLCEPIPSPSASNGKEVTIPSVTIFPMRKEKKASREENEVVCITEWRECKPGADAVGGSEGEDGNERYWLFVKRPEKGLLAGLFEPPTTPMAADTDAATQKETAVSSVARILDTPIDAIHKSTAVHQAYGAIPHIFSHINMSYHVQHLVLSPAAHNGRDTASIRQRPTPIQGAVWLDREGVESANIGTGVKKVWAEVYGQWGCFDENENGKLQDKGKGKCSKVRAAKTKGMASEKGKNEGAKLEEGKVVRKIMMPLMPRKRD